MTVGLEPSLSKQASLQLHLPSRYAARLAELSRLEVLLV